MKVKAISVQQPWATLIVIGAKHFETRSWQTSYRGRLAIHAGKRFSGLARVLSETEPFKTALSRAGYTCAGYLPLGALVGEVLLDGIITSTKLAELEPWPIGWDTEREFGDYRPGRWVWELVRPLHYPIPVPCRGELMLFDVEVPDDYCLPQQTPEPQQGAAACGVPAANPAVPDPQGPG